MERGQEPLAGQRAQTATTSEAPIPFDNSYGQLPARFYTRLTPPEVRAPQRIRVNQVLAEELGIDVAWLESDAAAEALAGNTTLPGSDPMATVYAGHQFGSWNPQLGDGRAILLGEVCPGAGKRYDLQLKGCGPTPYSRGGDGRSPLGPVLREYIVSEAMAALGVPTTRALAAVTTGQPVYRESALPGAILTRVAKSHIRIGTFEFFASREDEEGLAALLAHTLARHYPEHVETSTPALTLLRELVPRQAELIATWQLLGFVHGVMNTDNMLVSGETIDYGPCAFIDTYRAGAVFSSIDRGGRYAYANQPRIALFNLACLAQALLPLIQEEAGDDEDGVVAAQAAIDGFQERFAKAFRDGLQRKLGLEDAHDDDPSLFAELLGTMEKAGADFTLTFRRLSELADAEAAPSEASVAEIAELPTELDGWVERWRARCAREEQSAAQRQRTMLAENPALIPRNHLVEEAIVAAREASDFGPFHRLVDALADPYTYSATRAPFARPPRPEQVVTRTFCGT